MRLRDSLVASAALAALAAAPAAAAPKKLTLAELTARALAGPRARLAATDTDAARARADEADAMRLPKATAQGFFTASPEIRCVDTDCNHTAPDGFALQFSGVFGGASLQVVQPLYTFGKIAAGRDAAAAGVRAQAALEDEAAGDAAIDAARAYYGLKLARELRYMLEDGIDEIGKARERLDDTDRAGDVTVQDRLRVDTLLAEAKVQLEDASAGEEAALAAIRALVGDDDVDVDDDPLEAVKVDLAAAAAYDGRAAARPQVRAARDGAEAARALAELEEAGYFPDLALVGSATWADAQGVDHPPGWIYSQPYHVAGVGAAVVLRWNLDPFGTRAKVDRARAQADHAAALADAAQITSTLEVRTALSEATRARHKVDAATDGERASRAWVESVLQNDAIGTAEAKDVADSYIAWFQMRARLVSAIFAWDVATVRLARATGEFRAAAARPKEK